MLRRSQRTCKAKPIIEPSSSEPSVKRKRVDYPDENSNDSLHNSNSLHEDNSSGDEFDPAESLPNKVPSLLNLSESDSDNDDQCCSKTKAELLQQSDAESEVDDNVCQTNFDFTSLLNPEETTNCTKNNVKTKTLESVEENTVYDNVDVAKILSVGEGVHLGSVLNVADNPVEEKLKRDDNYTIPDVVEINVKLPSDVKCKKGQDMQNVLRRRMNTICKETQVLVHKVHILAWISYGNRLNNILNSPEVLGSALSLVPSKKAYPPKQCDLNYLEDYIKWFSKKIKLSSKTDPLSKITVSSLVKQFSNCEAKTRYELIVLFIAMLRSLGLSVRLVINFNVVSIKPSSEQLLGPVTEENQTKPSTSKPKEETVQKTPAKSEYFNKKSNKSENSKQKLVKKSSKTDDGSKKSKNKKTKVNTIDNSTDEEDEIFVKRNTRSKSEYFSKKPSTSPSDSKKPSLKKSKSVAKNKEDKIKILTVNDDNNVEENSETIVKKKIKNDFWAEVFLEMEEKWICVDIIGQRVYCIKEIYVSCITIP